MFLSQLEQTPALSFTINEVRIIDRLADLALLTGQKSAAAHLLTALNTVARQVANVGIRIHTTTKLILLQLQDDNNTAITSIQALADIIGDVRMMEITQAGLVCWEKSIPFNSGMNHQDRADCLVCLYDALGAFLLSSGRFGDAAQLFKQGIQTGENHPSPIVASRLLPMKMALANAIFQKGDPSPAKQLLHSVAAEVEATPIAGGWQMQLWDLQSRIALLQGDLGVAYALLMRIIKTCHQLKLVQAELRASINLALTKIVLNQSKEATDMLTACLQTAERVGENRLTSKIRRLMQVADNRMQATLPAISHGKTRKAAPGPLPATATAADDRIPGDNYLSFFEEKALLFQHYLAEGNTTKAAELVTQLRLYVERSDSALIAIRYQVLLFMYGYFTNAPMPGAFPIQDILHFLTEKNLLPELWQFRRLVGHTEFVSGDQRDAWNRENQRLLEQITHSLPPMMQALYLLNKWSPNEEYLAGYADQLLNIKAGVAGARFPLTRWWRSWRLMKATQAFNKQVNRYKDHLARHVIKGDTASLFAFTGGLSGTVSELWRHAANTLTISYLVLPDRIVIMARTFLKIQFYTTFISRVRLRRMVFAVRDSLYPAGKFRGVTDQVFDITETVDNTCDLLSQLSEILQLETILTKNRKGVRHIAFQVDDVLHGFPFSLLTINGETILNQVSISVVIDKGQAQRKELDLNRQTLLLMGVSEAVPGQRALPGVLTEIQQIQATLTNAGVTVRTMINKDATIDAMRQQLPEAPLAHIACHGLFNPEQPDQSGLLLSAGHVFTLREILSLKSLRKVQVLVLSSCRGAEHYVLPGRWLIGLPETFCRAGVGAVLAFLWPVDDDFATAFTTRFYSYLTQASPAEAFRLTMQDARNKRLGNLPFDYTQPRYWAGAVYYEG
ncbi:MAG TPA: CHAT domain-containing protein [Niastella sp.]